MKEQKYFKVVCMCGHVGRRNYIPIAFAVNATSRKEAAKIARALPRVKHNVKGAILECVEISFDRFVNLAAKNDKDPYLNAKNSRQQKEHPEIQSRILKIEEPSERGRKKERPLSNKYRKWKFIDRFILEEED